MPLSMISENPMMALSGVRSSWLILARNLDLVWLASSARVFSLEYFSARSASSRACLQGVGCAGGLRAFRVDPGGARAQVFVYQLLFVVFEAGYVGSDRDLAA